MSTTQSLQYIAKHNPNPTKQMSNTIDYESAYEKLCILVRESGHKGRVKIAEGMHGLEVFSMQDAPPDAIEFDEFGGAANNKRAIEELEWML